MSDDAAHEPEGAADRALGAGDASPEAPPNEPEGAAFPEAPQKKRKKKKRKGDAAAPGRRPGFPGFAATFPSDPALDELVLAFEQGNYARVREGSNRILDAKPARPDDVRRAARELLRRIDPDPIAVYLLAGAFLLLAFLSIWYWTHAHGAH
jgi:hypothetical protein